MKFHYRLICFIFSRMGNFTTPEVEDRTDEVKRIRFFSQRTQSCMVILLNPIRTQGFTSSVRA